tara:strand:- start:144 stop:461 length:318 start_codon:yes stop_codon:yes gene_type:complete
MGIRSLATKGFALGMSSRSSQHSSKASSYANKAVSSLRSAKSQKDTNKKIDLLIDGMSDLANAVREVSDSVTPIAKMNMVSALLSENIGELLNTQTAEIRGISKK